MPLSLGDHYLINWGVEAAAALGLGWGRWASASDGLLVYLLCPHWSWSFLNGDPHRAGKRAVSLQSEELALDPGWRKEIQLPKMGGRIWGWLCLCKISIPQGFKICLIFNTFKFFSIPIFIWLHWFFVMAHEIFAVALQLFLATCERDLVPWPRIEPWPPALGAWSQPLGHWGNFYFNFSWCPIQGFLHHITSFLIIMESFIWT